MNGSYGYRDNAIPEILPTEMENVRDRVFALETEMSSMRGKKRELAALVVLLVAIALVVYVTNRSHGPSNCVDTVVRGSTNGGSISCPQPFPIQSIDRNYDSHEHDTMTIRCICQ